MRGFSTCLFLFARVALGSLSTALPSDFCEACYECFQKGEVKHNNTQNRGISPKLEDHEFAIFVDPGAFSRKGQVRTSVVVNVALPPVLRTQSVTHCPGIKSSHRQGSQNWCQRSLPLCFWQKVQEVLRQQKVKNKVYPSRPVVWSTARTFHR